MKFILAILAFVGITEANSCASSGLAMKLGYQHGEKGTSKGNTFGQGSNTGYACFPVIRPAKPTSQPTKITITVTPHNTLVPISSPSYSNAQSSYFPTVDFYPWTNNIPTFTSQSTISTTTPNVPNNQQNYPIFTTPITQPIPVLPSTIVQPIQTTTDPYVIASPIPINQVYNQSINNLPTGQNTLFTPSFQIPLTSPNLPTLPISPSVTLPSEYNGFIFASNQPNQTLNSTESTSLQMPRVSQTIPLSTDFSNLNFDDIDFSTINLDDLFAANNLTLGQ